MDEVVLGEVSGVFGVRGEVRLMLHHREGETLFSARTATLVSPAGERREVRIVARPGAGKRVLGKIEGVDTPEAAAALMGWAIVVDRAVLSPPAEGEFYIHDLMDLPVFDESGAALGTLIDVVTGQERDIWVIQTDAGEGFVIASPENVRSVDVAGRRVVVATGAMSLGE
ncbi:MAG: ribosome maturation factor RimM [Pseudomonadota bacterium]|nr:ribosome maturation factor RimM [Pseudomonadota bacterium]